MVIYSHAWRNALLPVSTSIMGWIISVFTGGSLVIETTFALNGTRPAVLAGAEQHRL